MMRTIGLLLLLLFVASFLVGCGMVDSYPERVRRIRLINDINARGFVDDSDYIWFADHESTLTRWHTYVGR